MIKGYIFRPKGQLEWELGFVVQISVDDALYETYKNDYPTWDEAMKALIKKQIKEQ